MHFLESHSYFNTPFFHVFLNLKSSERLELQDKLKTDLLQGTELSEEEVGWKIVCVVTKHMSEADAYKIHIFWPSYTRLVFYAVCVQELGIFPWFLEITNDGQIEY